MRDAAHRRQHCCAIIEDMACSEFNLRLVAYCSWVERWDDGGESCAVRLCCAVLLLPFVLLVYESNEVTKNFVLLPESPPESFEQIIQFILGNKSAQVLILGKPYITLVVTSKIKPYHPFGCVSNNMSKKHIYYNCLLYTSPSPRD